MSRSRSPIRSPRRSDRRDGGWLHGQTIAYGAGPVGGWGDRGRAFAGGFRPGWVGCGEDTAPKDRELPHGVTRMVAPTWTASTGGWLHCAGSASWGFVQSCRLQSLFFKQTRMRRKVRECACGQRVSPRPQTGQEPESRGKSTRRSWLRNPNARCRASPHPNTPSKPPARCGVDRPTPCRRDNSAIVRPRVPSTLANHRRATATTPTTTNTTEKIIAGTHQPAATANNTITAPLASTIQRNAFG